MFSIVLPLITLERQPVLPTFRRSASLVRGNGGRAFVVWLGAALVTEAGAAIGGGLFHGIDSEAVQALAHAVPTTLLLPIAALPLVVMAFELLDRERVAAA
jgi:hypothetical protein